jgi:hypothetical protein
MAVNDQTFFHANVLEYFRFFTSGLRLQAQSAEGIARAAKKNPALCPLRLYFKEYKILLKSASLKNNCRLNHRCDEKVPKKTHLKNFFKTSLQEGRYARI